MPDQNTATPLTESRIRRILELQAELLRRTKKDKKKFLDVPNLPDIGKDETLFDGVAPQMGKHFADWNEDPAQFFKDRGRMLMKPLRTACKTSRRVCLAAPDGSPGDPDLENRQRINR